MRKNLALATAENWRPPLFIHPAGNLSRCLAGLRRFFDLQAGSIWNDMSKELARAHGHLLDVGCGAQPYRPLVPPSVKYTGMDIAESGEKFGYQNPDTIYYSGGVWPMENASVDTILSTETLEHVLDPAAFLAEAHRCLNKGGRIILTVPFAARWHFIPNDYWRFTPSGLTFLLRNAGFEDIRIHGRGNAVTVACYKNMALILKLLLPQQGSLGFRAGSVILGAIGFPLLAGMAMMANLSLRFDSGDDCLGYSAVAQKRS